RQLPPHTVKPQGEQRPVQGPRGSVPGVETEAQARDIGLGSGARGEVAVGLAREGDLVAGTEIEILEKRDFAAPFIVNRVLDGYAQVHPGAYARTHYPGFGVCQAGLFGAGPFPGPFAVEGEIQVPGSAPQIDEADVQIAFQAGAAPPLRIVAQDAAQ